MKTCKRTAQAMLFALLATIPAYAEIAPATEDEGGRVGNGGFAYVCRDTQGKISLARLLDLWEPEGISTWAKNDSVDAQLDAALAKLKDYSPNAWVGVMEHLKKFQASATFSERGLVSTEDAFPPYKPGPGCGYEQVARYEPLITETGASGLRIASEIYNSPLFTNSDRAALFFHEAIYFKDRLYNKATNSRRTRLIVGHLFSNSVMPNAVRLATVATLLGATRREGKKIPESEKVSQTMIAVPNPDRIDYEIRFDSVDGIDSSTLLAMTPAQKSAKYRCKTTGLFASKEPMRAEPNPVDTKWVKLSDLVGTYVYESSEKAVTLKGGFGAREFSSSEASDMGATVDNRIWLECERRDSKGKIKPVKFRNAFLKVPTGQHLYIMEDESLVVSDGSTPITGIDGEKYDKENVMNGYNPYLASLQIEVVRAAPKADAK